jgi:PAS domain S-box-containing protein
MSMNDCEKTREQLLESEKRYRLLAENVNDLIWTMNMDLRFTYMSPSVLRLLGFTVEEFKDRSLDEVMTPESLELVRAIIAEELEKESDGQADPERSRVVESELVTKSGATIPTETRASFLRDGDGRPVGILGITRDLTDRRLAEKDLRESKELLNSVLQNSPDFIANVDRDCELLFLNRTSVRKMDDLLGTDISRILHADSQEVFKQGVAGVFRTGKPASLEISVPIADHIHHLEIRMAPIVDAGKVVSVIANGTDITERKRVEEAMKLRLEFEKTISSISSRFVSSDIDSAINESLEDMGRLSGASRAYLFLYSEDGTAMNNTHEWCAEGVTPQIENLQGLPTGTISWWMEKLRNGEVILVKDVSMMPAEAETEKKMLQEQDIKSLLVFPLGIGGKLAGFVGFDDVVEARGWRDEDLRILQMSSDIIGHAIYRKRAEADLRENKELLTSVLQNSPDFIANIDRDVKLLFLNRTCTRNMDELRGLDAAGILPAGNQGAFKRGIERVFQTGEPISLEISTPAYDQTLHFEIRIAPVMDEGHVVSVIANGTDITERKRAEEALCKARDELEKRVEERTSDLEEAVRALRKSEADHARLAAATESSADGIVITDLNGIIQYVNPAFERITGFSRGECVGRNVQVCSGSEHEQQLRGEIMEALSREGIWRGCLVRTKKDGSSYREERTITAVKNASGEVINYAHIVRDVTEKFRLESIAQAVNTMSNTAYIFSGIRHEIGNPINSIGAVLKILKSGIDKYDKQAINNYIDRALHEISTVEILLNNLKSFNMYENLKLGDVNIPVFLDKFLTLVRTDSEKKGVAIAASVSPEIKFCRVDPRALQQVLMNVLTNAWDACEGRENSRISIGVSRQHGMVLIEVSDNGCGMSVEQLEDLFKPFYTGKANGTGLGLPIARKMLAMMNASIEVSSKLNIGTTASIQLPEAQSDTRRHR